MDTFAIIQLYRDAGLAADAAIIAARVHLDMAREPEPQRPPMPELLKHMPEPVGWAVVDASARHRVTVDAIMGDVRTHAISRARQDCYAAARNMGFTLPAIAAMFNRDHTTVLHGIRGHRMRAERAAKAKGEGQ